MKRLVAYDFDGTLIDSPHPSTGKDIWKEKTGEEYPHKGWWGRAESLSTDVFDIKPFPGILAKLKSDMADPNTHVIILTSRLERLRPQMENILNLNDITVDEIIMKDGAADKGDILMKYVEDNPDLERIEMYDDFAEGKPDKIKELTKIKDQLPENVSYILYYVEDGSARVMEQKDRVVGIIKEEIIKMNL